MNLCYVMFNTDHIYSYLHTNTHMHAVHLSNLCRFVFSAPTLYIFHKQKALLIYGAISALLSVKKCFNTALDESVILSLPAAMTLTCPWTWIPLGPADQLSDQQRQQDAAASAGSPEGRHIQDIWRLCISEVRLFLASKHDFGITPHVEREQLPGAFTGFV